MRAKETLLARSAGYEALGAIGVRLFPSGLNTNDWRLTLAHLIQTTREAVDVWANFMVWVLADHEHGLIRLANSDEVTKAINCVAQLFRERCTDHSQWNAARTALDQALKAARSNAESYAILAAESAVSAAAAAFLGHGSTNFMALNDASYIHYLLSACTADSGISKNSGRAGLNPAPSILAVSAANHAGKLGPDFSQREAIACLRAKYIKMISAEKRTSEDCAALENPVAS